MLHTEYLPKAIGHRRFDTVVFSLFFLTGGASLVYEISWSRQIGLLVGNTAAAVALVLAAYFAGLAAGQLLGARFVSRWSSLLGYGIAELFAAAWACLIPWLLDQVRFLGSIGSLSPSSRDFLQSVLCFAVLFPSTIAIGATLPFMAEHLARSGRDGGRRVAFAYALNTAGGLTGVLLATPYLAAMGVRASGFYAAAIATLCGLTACGLARIASTPVPQPIPVPNGNARSGDGATPWLTLAVVSGFGTLGLEVLYTRMFSLVFHNSTYTFGAVLAVFLAGLALAAALVSWLGRWCSARSLATFGCAAGSIATLISVLWFVRRTGLEYFASGETFGGYLVGVFVLTAVVAMPPITLLGMVLPAALLTAGGGRDAGRLAGANTIASAVGAITAGFVALPQLGLWGAFGAVSLLFGVVAVVLTARRRPAVATGLTAVVLAGIAGVVASPRQSPAWRAERGETIVRRWESDYGWIDVVRSERNGSLKVRQNLHYRHGSTGPNAVREYRQGRLPLLLHRQPTDVAFLGLGTGLTAAPVAADLDVQRAVIVELIPEVVEAARLLGDENMHVVDLAKVEVQIDDARHYLQQTDRQFDVIVSDLFVPWESRTGYLYTVEHFTAARKRLKPDGLFCQWIALYQVGPREFELIADSLASVFPETTLWWGQLDSRYGMVAIIGSDQPLEIDAKRLAARMTTTNDGLPGGRDPLLTTPQDLRDLLIGSWSVRHNSSLIHRRLNTDEHPWVEFTAPISHRAGRTLKRAVLRRYYDDVLADLSSEGIHWEPDPLTGNDATSRRKSRQRFMLFGQP